MDSAPLILKIIMQIKLTGDQTYIEWKSKKDGMISKLLLNAVIKVVGFDENSKIALVKIKTSKMEESRLLDFKVFSSRTKWIAWLNRISWLGSQENMEFYKMFLNDTGQASPMIILNSFTGRYTKDEIDLLITDLGVFDRENHLYPYNDGFVVFQIKEKWIYVSPCEDFTRRLFGTYKAFLENPIPNSFLDTWYSLFGDRALMTALLGWLLSVFFMPEVLDCRGQNFFPFYFLHGNTEAGKTALLENALKIFGISYGSNYCDTSPFMESWHLSKTSLIPIWRDEYRERGKYVLQKESFARSLYGLVPIEKGTADQSIKTYRPLTTWLLSGEGTPRDQAFIRRCVIFAMDKKNKVAKKAFYEAAEKASIIFPAMLKDLWLKGFDKKIFKQIYVMSLQSANAEAEEKICYATIGALFGLDAGVAALNEANEYWLKSDSKDSIPKDDTVSQFFTDVYHFCVSNGWLQAPMNGKPKMFSFIEVTADEIRINHKPLIEAVTERSNWTNKSSHGRDIANLMVEKYNAERKTVKIHGHVAYALIINIDQATHDDSLQRIISAYEEAEESVKEKEARDTARETRY